MPAASLEERQEFTPDGQELPPWLGYEEAETGAQPVVFQAEAKVTTTIDGVVITTGTVVQLPQTYYGPSIPLGEGWAYGGTSSPPPGATGTSPDADPTVSTDASSSQATATPNKDSTAAAPTTSLSNAATTTGTSPLPPIPAPSASPLSSAVLTSSSSPISPSSISTLSTASQPSTDPSASTIPNNFDVHTDRRTTLAVLIPSLIGSLLVAVLILLVVICYKRRSDYRRAGTTAPSDADPSSIRGPSRLIATRAASNNYSKVPTADPGGDASIGPADVAATSAPGIDKKPYGNSGLYDPSGPAPASGDITDHPYTSHPHSRSNILSRISLGLGLGAPPIARSISNGTAEKALPGGRMPSWAAMADIGTAVRRHVSSSTFGRVISRASGYGPAGGLDGVGEVDVGEKQGLHASSSGAVAGTGGVPGGYTDKKHSEGIETLNTGIKTGQPTPGGHQPSDSLDTTIPPSHSQSNSRSMGSEELFFAPPPSASTYLYGLFRSRSSRQTSHSGGTGSGAGTHTSHSGSAVGSGEGSDESRGTVITHGMGPSSWRDRVWAFAGDDFGVRMRTRAVEADAGERERGGGEDGRTASNAALPLGANDHLPAYSYANVPSMECHHGTGIAGGRHTAQGGLDDYNDSTLRARHHRDPSAATDTPAQQGRYISVGIPETPASRVGSVPSFHSSNSTDNTSPARLEGGFTTGQGQGKRDPSERYGRDGRSRFPSTGGDRLDFPLPPVAPWGQAAGAESRLGKGRGDEADSVIAQSDYHSAHSQLSSRPPSSRQSTQLIRKSTPPKPEETKQDTSSPLGTIRRALGLSGLFRSRLSSRPTSGPVPLPDTAEGSAAVADLSTQRSAALGTSERTRSFESGSRLSHGDTLAMGSVEGPLTSRALRARQALSHDIGQTGGDGSTGEPARGRQAEAVEIGRALGALGVRGGLGGSEVWDEFGQLRDRRRPTNPIPPLARYSHIGSIHISDSSPSIYSRATRGTGGTSSSGAVQSHQGDSASVAGSGTGSGSRSGGASAGHGTGNDSIGSGVSKVSAGVPDRALRGRRSAATLVRSSSLKSTATNAGTTQLSSAASTPIQLLPNDGQLPRSVPPYPARPQRLQPLSTSAPSTDESER